MALAAAAGLMLVLSALQIGIAWRSASWPSVQGVVHQLKLENISIWRRGHSVISARYEYEVGGHAYEGREVAFDESSVEELRRFFGDIAQGDPVTVYYSPKNPARSCLRAGLHAKNLWVGAGVGALVLILIPIALQRMSQKILILTGREEQSPPSRT
ncbi:MAG: DUF3592 domain-containing protein [Verrucomicrobium sp.]